MWVWRGGGGGGGEGETTLRKEIVLVINKTKRGKHIETYLNEKSIVAIFCMEENNYN